jgi:hypothetical protein
MLSYLGFEMIALNEMNLDELISTKSEIQIKFSIESQV